MTKELKTKWSQITSRYLQMYNNRTLQTLPMDVQQLMWELASAMQDAICADSLSKARAKQTRNERKFWRTL